MAGMGSSSNIPSQILSLDFDEPDNENNILKDADGQIKGASFAKIIYKMVDPQNFEIQFVMDMLYTYRSFATSFEVLGALIQRFETAASDRALVLIRVCNVLTLWLDKVFYDFEKDCPALGDQLQAFLDRCIKAPDTKTNKITTQVSSILAKRLRGEGRIKADDGSPLSLNVGKDCPVPHQMKDKEGPLLFRLHPEEVARQLTLMEWALWKEIRPWECFGLAWTKKDREIRAPHICEAQNRFNRISGWVATSIISTEKLADRSKLLAKFVELAVHLNKLNNFAGTLQVVSGLSNSAVHRLGQTWNAVGSTLRKQYEELAKYNERNSRVLRDRIRQANPPCIPFFGMYQTDLTFVEEGNPDLIGPNGNLHNCAKRKLTAEIIKSIRQYQLQPYIFASLPEVQAMLLNVPVLEDGMLFDMSEWIEPRKGAVPKTVRPSGFDELEALSKAEAGDKIELDLVMGYPFYVADAPSNIQFNPVTKTIKHASITKIVEHMTHHLVTPDSALENFLISYRSFITPSELFDLVEKRWNMPLPKDKSPMGLENYVNQFQRPVHIRVTSLVKLWIEKHYYDFEDDPQLLKRLLTFVQITQNAGMPYTAALSKSVAKMQAGVPPVIDETPPPLPTQPFPGFDPQAATLLDVDAIELARQLTIALHSQFAVIKPKECMDKASKSADRANKAPNLLRMINYNEAITLWFEDSLQKADTDGSSPAVLTKLLEILDYSAEHLRNWQLVLIVIDAIQAFLPNNEPGPQFDQLSPHLWTAYDKYRQIFAESSKWRESLPSSIVPPALLPIRAMLSEIEFIEERYGKDQIGTLINFEKRILAGDVCKLMMTLQRIHYNLTPVPLLQQMINLRYRQYIVMIGTDVSPTHNRKTPSSSTPAAQVPPEFKQALMDYIGSDADFRKDLSECMVDLFRDQFLTQSKNILAGKQGDFQLVNHSNGTPDAAHANVFTTIHGRMGILANAGKSNSTSNLNSGSNPPPSPSSGIRSPLTPSTSTLKNGTPVLTKSNSVHGIAHGNVEGSQLIVVPVDKNGIMTLRPIPNSDEVLYNQASQLLQKDFAGSIDVATFFDESGVVYGKPAHISLDVIYRGSHHYLCSFNVEMKEYDVHLLVQLGKLYKLKFPQCSLACIVVTRSIPTEVRSVADRFKMKVYTVPDPNATNGK